SKQIPQTLDELSMAAGFRLGQWNDGKVSAIVGAGFSGDNFFADSQCIFGIAHLLYEKPVDDHNSWVFSLDYNGVAALFPDVPLPGITYIHREDVLSYELGFPHSA